MVLAAIAVGRSAARALAALLMLVLAVYLLSTGGVGR